MATPRKTPLYALVLVPALTFAMCAAYIRSSPPLPATKATVWYDDPNLPTDLRALIDALAATRGQLRDAQEHGRTDEVRACERRIARIEDVLNHRPATR